MHTRSRAQLRSISCGLRAGGRRHFLRSNPVARCASVHRCGVAHPTCLRSLRTMMMYPNSPRQTGRRVAQSGERSLWTTVTLKHSRTGRTATLRPEVTAATEFRVIDLIAQHDPQPDTQLAGCRDTRFSHFFFAPAYGGRSAGVRDRGERLASPPRPKDSAGASCLAC